MNLEHFEVAFFEEPPWDFHYDYAADKDVATLRDDYASLPEPFLQRLDEFSRHRVDETRCWNCLNHVGFYLSDDEGRGRVDWEDVGLARQDDGPVAILCGSCTPSVPGKDWSRESKR